jgi:hypothetical protein
LTFPKVVTAWSVRRSVDRQAFAQDVSHIPEVGVAKRSKSIHGYPLIGNVRNCPYIQDSLSIHQESSTDSGVRVRV